MRKFLDTKAGATFFEELPNLTICPRKDCIEIIYKLRPGIHILFCMRNKNEEKLNFVVYNQQNCIHFQLTAQGSLLTAYRS